jgi:hypothetical protein
MLKAELVTRHGSMVASVPIITPAVVILTQPVEVAGIKEVVVAVAARPL